MSLYSTILSRIISRALESSQLFFEDEIDILGAYLQLSNDSRFLFSRLFTRQHNWIRCDSLDYKDVSNVPVACNELILKRFFECEKDFDDGLQVALGLLSLPEMRILASFHSITKSNSNGKSASKDELSMRIIEKCKTQKTIFGVKMSDIFVTDCLKKLGKMVRIRLQVKVIIERCIIVYLCPFSWDEVSLVNDILTISDRRKYPSYKIHPCAVFKSRVDLFQYYEYLKLEHEIQSLVSDKRWEDAYRIFQEHHPLSYDDIRQDVIDIHQRLAFVLTRIMSEMCLVLARLQKFNEEFELLNQLLSQPIFCIHKRARWWRRILLLMERHISKEEDKRGSEEWKLRILSTGREALGDPMLVGEGHRKAVDDRLRRIRKMQGLTEEEQDLIAPDLPTITITAAKMPAKSIGKKSRWKYDLDDSVEASVEELALNHYLEQGWLGVHAENSVFNTLFGLLFWDILFLDIPEAFVHPFQVAPLDLSTEFFYFRRSKEITSRLADIRQNIEGTKDRLRRYYESEVETQTFCIGVNWAFDIEFLIMIVETLKHSLWKLMELFAKDYRTARSGIPDLLLWNHDEQKLKLVEVKGPGDTLMEHQEIWINRLIEFGIPVEICHVKSLNSTKKTK